MKYRYPTIYDMKYIITDIFYVQEERISELKIVFDEDKSSVTMEFKANDPVSEELEDDENVYLELTDKGFAYSNITIYQEEEDKINEHLRNIGFDCLLSKE